LWSIGPLAAFDLGKFGNQRPSPAVQEVEDRLALRLEAEARFPLPIGADTEIRDELAVMRR
jgi:hypothetical protein